MLKHAEAENWGGRVVQQHRIMLPGVTHEYHIMMKWSIFLLIAQCICFSKLTRLTALKLNKTTITALIFFFWSFKYSYSIIFDLRLPLTSHLRISFVFFLDADKILKKRYAAPWSAWTLCPCAVKMAQGNCIGSRGRIFRSSSSPGAHDQHPVSNIPPSYDLYIIIYHKHTWV